MKCRPRCIAPALALLLFAAAAGAQSDAAALAQQRYEREVAACNSGALPAPVRAGCVRDAGQRLDRLRGGPPSEEIVTTPDGRATVVEPEGANPPASSSDAATSRDGRAEIVPSSNNPR